MSQAIRIENRFAEPSGFGGIAAHAFGNNRERPGPTLFRGKLQTPSGGQTERFGQFHHHQRHRSGTQRFFGHGQNLDLILAGGDQKIAGVENREET